MNSANYPPPVDLLLSLEPIQSLGERWPDYRKLGLSVEHVPDLLRMSADQALYNAPIDRSESWAPIHAKRALGQIGAVSAVPQLLEFLDLNDDDWAHEELPRVFVMMGSAILPELVEFLNDPQRSYWARIAVSETLKDLALGDPDQRESVITAISQVLAKWASNDETLNAFLISGLMDLHAVEAAPLMEEAFLGNRVDITVNGDWEDVQIELGLLSQRKTPFPTLWSGLRGLTGPQRTPESVSKSGKSKKEGQTESRTGSTQAQPSALVALLPFL